MSATGATQEYYTGLSALADQENFIVVYPEGRTSAALPEAHWNAWDLDGDEADDVAFVSQLLDSLQSRLCLDRTRIYANGASNGAMMAVRLACSLSDRIAAVSVVAGLYYPPMSLSAFPNPGETCGGLRAVPLVAFHGTADDVVPFDGGDGLWNFRLPIDSSSAGDTALSEWAQHNGCSGPRSEHQLASNATLVSYDACSSGATVQLYVVEGGGHTWPQLAPDPLTGISAVNATLQTWQFFSQHRLDDDPGTAVSRFESQSLVSGLPEPVDFAFAPDGRVFVASRLGQVLVVKNGVTLAEPFVTLSVNTFIQRGLMGLALDPEFETNGFVYLYYTVEHDAADPTGTKTGQLVRVTAQGDAMVPGSTVVLLGTTVGSTESPSCSDFPLGTDCLPADGCCHIGGALRFGNDGSLFVSTGDAAVSGDALLNAQRLDSLAGKILRINPATGEGLTGNPFYNGDPTANRSKVWAYGFREPFRMSIQPGTGLAIVGDVGSVYSEELDAAVPGGNFGWPCYEGTIQHVPQNQLAGCQDLYESGETTTHPFFGYPHSATEGSSVVGGIFYAEGPYPASYNGALFYGDFNRGEISAMRLGPDGFPVAESIHTVIDQGDVHEFVRQGPVDFEVGPGGAIYYLSLPLFGGQGELRRLDYVGSLRSPTASFTFSPSGGTRTPLSVSFDATSSSDPDGQPLRYAWDFGDGSSTEGATPSHVYTTSGRFAVELTVANKDDVQATQTAYVQVGQPPRVTITSPQYGDSFSAGGPAFYQGQAFDWLGNSIGEEQLAWSVVLHHCEAGAGWICHWHSYQDSPSKGGGGLLVPPQGQDLMYLEIILSATDSRGLIGEERIVVGPDSDGDNLLDFTEALVLGTDRNDSDTDRDGVPDGDDDDDDDGCTNFAELGPNPMTGGRRDPTYTWDYFNPSGDGYNRIDDILTVLGAYFSRPSDSEYSTLLDRGGRSGPDPWNLLPPDGRVLIDDILAAVGAYLNDCP